MLSAGVYIPIDSMVSDYIHQGVSKLLNVTIAPGFWRLLVVWK